jgi:hypothetical protein
MRWIGLFAVCALSLLLLASRAPRTLPDLRPFAPAAGLVVLAVVSAAWSIDPRLTLERAISFGVLLTAGAALAVALRGDGEAVDRVLGAIVVAAALVSLAGLAVLVYDSNLAVQASTASSPARWKGLGQNPNTVAMLDALALPLALRFMFQAGRRRRVLVGAAFAVLYLTLVASGSRGGFIAAIGSLMLASLLLPAHWTPRLASSAGVIVLMIGGVFVTNATLKGVHSIPGETPSTPVGGSAPGAPPKRLNFFAPNAVTLPAMQDEIGADVGGVAARTLIGTSGRAVAWSGAIEQGLQRPILGFGFGTEERVFVDRFYFFQSARAENSYIGFFLQLGVVGMLLYLAVAVGLLRRLLRLRTNPQAVVLGCTVLAGYLLACVQSYVYSVGNISTLPFWLCALLLFSIPVERRSPV